MANLHACVAHMGGVRTSKSKIPVLPAKKYIYGIYSIYGKYTEMVDLSNVETKRKGLLYTY